LRKVLDEDIIVFIGMHAFPPTGECIIPKIPPLDRFDELSTSGCGSFSSGARRNGAFIIAGIHNLAGVAFTIVTETTFLGCGIAFHMRWPECRCIVGVGA
jgi:hypothetical protein